MNNQNSQQRLYWSLSRPLKYMGLTIDEWLVTLVGVIPGIFMINSANLKLGFIFLIGGIMMCWVFKKFKRLSNSFKLKSFLIAKGFMPAPRLYPSMLRKNRVGK